jgi:hypothetical protein
MADLFRHLEFSRKARRSAAGRDLSQYYFLSLHRGNYGSTVALSAIPAGGCSVPARVQELVFRIDWLAIVQALEVRFTEPSK